MITCFLLIETNKVVEHYGGTMYSCLTETGQVCVTKFSNCEPLTLTLYFPEKFECLSSIYDIMFTLWRRYA